MNKVIHILSVGHSGSTLLDIMLGQFQNFFSSGELKHLSWQLFRELKGQENLEGVCTCGNKFQDCFIWKKILKGITTDINCEIEELPEKFNIKHIDSLSFFSDPIHLKIYRKLYKKALKNFPILIRFLFPLLNNININNNLLYRIIFEVTKTQYIVDSSKDIIRFNELKELCDIFPLIIIRNYQDIANSKYTTQTEKQIKKHWVDYYNNQVFPTISEMNEDCFHVISYEKFIDNPLESIQNLSKKINIDIRKFSELISMKDMHLVAGNPMRYSEQVKIRKKKLDFKEYRYCIKNSGINNFYWKYLFE